RLHFTATKSLEYTSGNAMVPARFCGIVRYISLQRIVHASSHRAAARAACRLFNRRSPDGSRRRADPPDQLLGHSNRLVDAGRRGARLAVCRQSRRQYSRKRQGRRECPPRRFSAGNDDSIGGRARNAVHTAERRRVYRKSSTAGRFQRHVHHFAHLHRPPNACRSFALPNRYIDASAIEHPNADHHAYGIAYTNFTPYANRYVYTESHLYPLGYANDNPHADADL